MDRRDFLTSALGALGIGALWPSSVQAQQISEAVMTQPNPMAAAEYLSQLETIQHIPALYTFYGYMHPDSQEIVPRATIIGWYQTDFQPRGPRQAYATSYVMLDQWVWDVNGVAYSNVAEVSFTQAFQDGTVTNDVVRLCWSGGRWNWFFGRDRTWVEEQNRRFSLKDNTPQVGVAPYGFDALRTLESDWLSLLPQSLVDPFNGRTFLLQQSENVGTGSTTSASEITMEWVSDHRDDLVPLGYVILGSLEGSFTDYQALDAIATEHQNRPPLEFHGWNSSPSRGFPWIYLGVFQNDMVGFVDSLYLVSNGRFALFSMRSRDQFEVLSAAIT